MIESGSILILKVPGTNISKSFVVENFAGKLLLAQVHNPYARLHFAPDGLDYRSNTPQGNNLFSLTPNDCNRYSLVIALRDKATKKDTTFGLALNAEGMCAMVDLSDANSCCKDKGLCYEFDIYVEEMSAEGVVSRGIGVPIFDFEKWQLRRLMHEGYIRLRNIIDHTALEECIATINHELGLPGKIVAGGIQEGEALGKLAGNLSNCAAVRNVLTGQAQAVLNAVFGVDNYEKNNLSAQIALRFPELDKTMEMDSSKIVWHTDGLRQGHSHGFSLLVGVCLSDVENDFCGNFTVWPGSHLLLHQCKVPPHGALNLNTLHRLATLTENKHFSNFAGMLPPELGQQQVEEKEEKKENESDEATDVTQTEQTLLHNNVPDLPVLGVPLQLKLRKGDMVLAHPDLAHAGAPNYSSAIRHMLFFRIKVKVKHSAATDKRNISSSSSSNNGGSDGGGNGASREKPFIDWEEVVQQHAVDMWADLPVLRRELGQRELEHAMQLYVPEYRPAPTPP